MFLSETQYETDYKTRKINITVPFHFCVKKYPLVRSNFTLIFTFSRPEKSLNKRNDQILFSLSTAMVKCTLLSLKFVNCVKV